MWMNTLQESRIKRVGGSSGSGNRAPAITALPRMTFSPLLVSSSRSDEQANNYRMVGEAMRTAARHLDEEGKENVSNNFKSGVPGMGSDVVVVPSDSCVRACSTSNNPNGEDGFDVQRQPQYEQPLDHRALRVTCPVPVVDWDSAAVQQQTENIILGCVGSLLSDEDESRHASRSSGHVRQPIGQPPRNPTARPRAFSWSSAGSDQSLSTATSTAQQQRLLTSHGSWSSSCAGCGGDCPPGRCKQIAKQKKDKRKEKAQLKKQRAIARDRMATACAEAVLSDQQQQQKKQPNKGLAGDELHVVTIGGRNEESHNNINDSMWRSRTSSLSLSLSSESFSPSMISRASRFHSTSQTSIATTTSDFLSPTSSISTPTSGLSSFGSSPNCTAMHGCSGCGGISSSVCSRGTRISSASSSLSSPVNLSVGSRGTRVSSGSSSVHSPGGSRLTNNCACPQVDGLSMPQCPQGYCKTIARQKKEKARANARLKKERAIVRNERRQAYEHLLVELRARRGLVLHEGDIVSLSCCTVAKCENTLSQCKRYCTNPLDGSTYHH